MSASQPSPSGLTICQETREGATRIRAAGTLRAAAAAQLRGRLVQAVEARPARVVVDLLGIEDLDVAGLGALVAGCLWAHQAGVPIAILPSAAVRNALTAAKLDRYLTFCETA